MCATTKSIVSAIFLYTRPSFCIVSPSHSTQKRHQNLGQHKMSTLSAADQYKHCNLQCLKDLGDDEQKKMDVIVAGHRADATEHILFFGGDVQDYPENMLSHRDNGQYVRWNSLATAALLCQRFPTAMVMIFKPHHMHLKTFSVYSQFVESNDFGCPTHSKNYGAWQVLQDVYMSAVRLALQSGPDDESNNAGKQTEAGQTSAAPVDQESGPSFGPLHAEEGELHSGVPLHLVGFSKGCIVLNQLIYELKSAKANSSLSDFVHQVHGMTWLDGGHSGGSNTWVTNPDVLCELAALKVDIIVHVTPYQVKDEMRKWIGKEKRRFVEQLLKAGAKVSDTLHFEDLPKSIDNHFRVLEVF